MRNGALIPLFAAVGLGVAASAAASAPPVGPLPAGPTSSITTQRNELVAVALPHRAGGRVWRIARAFNSSVVREVSEADVGSNVVIVFRAAGSGTATVKFGLTKGETAKAFEARTFRITVK
jgi:hypothetical protein